MPAKQRHTDAGQLAKTIASDAYENGIPHAILGRVLKVLTTNNNLDQTTCTTIVKNLYPLERVSSKLVTQVVCCLGPSKNKPSPATQALLLRWLITARLVYDLRKDAGASSSTVGESGSGDQNGYSYGIDVDYLLSNRSIIRLFASRSQTEFKLDDSTINRTIVGINFAHAF